MNYSFHPEAELEFLEAIAYLDDCDEDLGLDFSRQVYRVIRLLTQFPNLGTPIEDRFRRCLIERFRYGLIYEIIDDEIVIQVVMHTSRDPEYWKTRVYPD
ncbi:MAG: type II toxin-antitoxin system RelE/ParE family toxin [Pyrinomonadaceae bacterium]|nr:type II toxin-antitoxin system RelE/ParE family toxin [Acidobacteriota bacterium]MBP7475861.1 type II toxin-antitoxin system RelE/ParE family toxin [Pyrinomonadaceae bacterium]MBP9110259.1 type II toxin-antitoxin system RelE/ParE family toxin [Pyrinomonadaceae bacterium]